MNFFFNKILLYCTRRVALIYQYYNIITAAVQLNENTTYTNIIQILYTCWPYTYISNSVKHGKLEPTTSLKHIQQFILLIFLVLRNAFQK